MRVQELYIKGIDDELINKAIEHYWKEEKDIFGTKREAVNDLQLAKRALEKRIKKGQFILKNREEKLKLVQYLARLGFSFDTSKEVIKEIKNYERQ